MRHRGYPQYPLWILRQEIFPLLFDALCDIWVKQTNKGNPCVAQGFPLLVLCYYSPMILVISSKNVYAAQRLAQEAGSQNMEVKIMDVRALVARGFKVDVNQFDVLYIRDPYLNGSPKYIPKIIALAKKFKAAGKRVADSNITDGQLGQGKWADYQKLRKADLLIPLTSQSDGRHFSKYDYPFILKWIYGFKGRHVFFIRGEAQLKKILPLHPKKEWLVQEFIKADYEYKIITVGYKALPIILRFDISDGGFGVDFDKHEVLRNPPLLLRRGSGRGCNNSSLDTTSLSPKANKNPGNLGDISPQEGRTSDVLISLAESASKLLGRELAKVDILESQGKFYILEVNRFPGLKSFEELTKYNAIRDFISYLQK
jgi:glutathione synthase/RimK-type ligase-like ATP-grasp enzyme